MISDSYSLAALLSQVSGKKCKYCNKYENLKRAYTSLTLLIAFWILYESNKTISRRGCVPRADVMFCQIYVYVHNLFRKLSNLVIYDLA
jgi:hypothetical protein